MKKAKQFLSAALATVMVLSLAACGQGTATVESTAGESTTGESTAENTAGESTAPSQSTGNSEPVTVTFWDCNAGDQRTEYYEKLIADFEAENPDIDIEYLGLSFSDALSKYQTAIAAEETPDVGTLNSSWCSTVFGMGHCVPLDDMFAGWDGAADMDKGAIEGARGFSKDNKLYMLPTSTNFMVMWANTKMFDEAGMKLPTTWDEFFDAAEKLRDESKEQYGYTIRGGQGSAAVLPDLICSYLGVNEIFDENGKLTFNCDEGAEFLDRYFGLYGAYTPESDITAGYKEISANFDSGVSALFFHNLGSYGSHVEAFGGEEGFAAIPLPVSSNGKYVNDGTSLDGAAIFDTCENPEAAWKWVTYLGSHEANGYWNQSIGQLPTNTLCYEDSWMKEKAHIQCAVNQLSADNTVTVVPPVYLPEYGTINTTYLEPAIQSVMTGDMTSKELLEMWAEYWEAAYADYMGK